MGIRKNTTVTATPRVRFFLDGNQIFERDRSLDLSPGDVVELYGRRLSVESVGSAFDLITENTNVDVYLGEVQS